MKQYELLVVFKPNVDAEEVDKMIEKMTADIEGLKGKLESSDKIGRKKLAYEINNFRDGYFVDFRLSLPEENVVEFKRILKLNDNVLRTMFLTADKVAQEV